MSDSPYIIEVTAENFGEVVLQGSNNHPVLVDFWADWCQPCQALMPVLSRLAEEYQGQFILAKVNSDQNQALSAEYGVRSLPTIKLFRNGGPVDEFMGALPESRIREFIDKHIERESDKIHALGLQALQQGDLEQALALLTQANELDPGRAKIVVDLASILAQTGESERAEALLQALPSSEKSLPEVAGLLARMEFAREAADLPTLDQLQSAADSGDLKARYQLAVRQLAEGEYAAAMDSLLLIMQKDRKFEDDIGRKTLLKVFDMLGKDPLVETYRRKMFNYLY
ncbi:MAG TPA: thioredoxin [Gammaproteobacteria bacterium]|nr:thioredoxin [Gammaproteobacteria bacterium]